MAQLENNFRTNLCRKLKIQHAEKMWIQKLHGGFYQAGLPDTLFGFDGHISVVEFKADRHRFFESDNITKLQIHTLRCVHLAGGLSGVWHWNAEKKLLQVFNTQVLMDGTWEFQSAYYAVDTLVSNTEALKKALWHDLYGVPSAGGVPGGQ